MAVTIESPHPFKERILVFGGGGSGKTSAVLKCAQYTPNSRLLVIESDFSWAYERALATEYGDMADRVQVWTPEPEWESWTAALAEAIDEGDPDSDWLAIDSITPSWEMVQNWMLHQLYGEDLATFTLDLKKQFKGDLKGFNRALTDAMNWPAIKKEYHARVYRPIQRWKGHLIITAQAKGVTRDDSDQTQMEFGPLGYKPAGQGDLMYVASSNIFLDHPKRGVWRATSTKDRNRDEMDKQEIEDFALDYLVDIAGWEMKREK